MRLLCLIGLHHWLDTTPDSIWDWHLKCRRQGCKAEKIGGVFR